MSQFVRVKRDRHTFFIHADPDDSVASIKRELGSINPEAFPFDKIRLLFQSQVLEEDDSLREYNIENNAILHLVCLREDGSWEEPHVFTPTYGPTDDKSLRMPDQLIQYLVQTLFGNKKEKRTNG